MEIQQCGLLLSTLDMKNSSKNSSLTFIGPYVRTLKSPQLTLQGCDFAIFYVSVSMFLYVIFAVKLKKQV